MGCGEFIFHFFFWKNTNIKPGTYHTFRLKKVKSVDNICEDGKKLLALVMLVSHLNYLLHKKKLILVKIIVLSSCYTEKHNLALK